MSHYISWGLNSSNTFNVTLQGKGLIFDCRNCDNNPVIDFQFIDKIDALGIYDALKEHEIKCEIEKNKEEDK